MAERLRPLADHVVVRRTDPAAASEGGILLPDTAKDKPTRGTVVAVGPGKSSDTSLADVLCFNYVAGNPQQQQIALKNAEKVTADGKRVAVACPRDPNGVWPAVETVGRVQLPAVKVGDTVLFSSYAGSEVTVNGEPLLVMREADILAVVESGA